MKVVEHDTSLINLHFGFSEHYQDHELFCHIREVTPLQPNALEQSGHPSSIHAFEHGHFPFFLVLLTYLQFSVIKWAKQCPSQNPFDVKYDEAIQI
jgi:hypothetical protein